MINGIYLTASGMNVDQKRMDVLSSNLSNIDSIGFKRRDINFVSYGEMMMSNLRSRDRLGSLSKGLIIEEICLDLKGGSIKSTHNPFHMAINDLNFFVVEDGQGNQLLTRDGSFSVNDQNFLVNHDGYHVQGERGSIVVEKPDKFAVDEKGNILIDGNFLDRLKIAAVQSARDLAVTNSSYYMLSGDGAEAADNEAVIKQGFLEVSNVNGVEQMVEMISVMRSYEANQKVLMMQDEALSKTVNQVGKTNI